MRFEKKLLSLLLCVVLCTVCCNVFALEYTTANKVFSITYDEETFAFDDHSYLYENTNEYLWLFMLYQSQLKAVIDVDMEYLPEFEGRTLYTADANDRNAYLEATLDAFVDNNIQYIDTVIASDLQIPFYIFSLKDDNGARLRAETIVNGWAIGFTAYHPGAGQTDDELLNVLKEIVLTFQPIIKQ